MCCLNFNNSVGKHRDRIVKISKSCNLWQTIVIEMRFFALERGCRDENFNVSHIFLGKIGPWAKHGRNFNLGQFGRLWYLNVGKNKTDFCAKFQIFISNSYGVIVSQRLKKFSEDDAIDDSKCVVRIVATVSK